MKKILLFEELAEKSILEAIKEIKKGLKKNFIAFIVYGSYITGDFTLSSDIDCYIITKNKTINGIPISHWLVNVLTKVYSKLRKLKQAKKLGKHVPILSLYPVELKEFKEEFYDGDPSTLDVILFGKLYYPKKGEILKFFKFKLKIPQRKKYLEITFNKDVRHLLVIHVRQFIKKCLLVARRIYFIGEKTHLKKKEISKHFDKKFKKISREVPLKKLNNNLNKDLDKLSIKQLIEIISQCNKFLLLAQKVK